MRPSLALALIGLVVAGCGQPTSTGARSPSPGIGSRAYVALVQGVYAKYNVARGNAYDYCVFSVDPPNCHDRGVAMIAVWEQFLKDLDRTPAPPQFVADDRTIRTQLPRAIADLQAMVAAARANDGTGVLSGAQAYISDMQPSVTDALGDVYSPWRTN